MIVKTRQSTAAHSANHGVGPARGVLTRNASAAGDFRHSRTAPAAELRELIEHFWIVRWDLGAAAPQLVETLPHPSVHVVIEAGNSRIAGPPTGRFTRTLEGRGCVFGIKFRPGGFHPWLQRPVASIADRMLLLHEVFGARSADLEPDVLRGIDDAAMIAVATDFMKSNWRRADAMIGKVADIVGTIAVDRTIMAVEHVAERAGMNARALQRLFRTYVGVSPKWVINRYRLHEAVEQVARGEPASWTRIAQDLGYFDQAHFIRDFRRLTGRTPAQYAREAHRAD